MGGTYILRDPVALIMYAYGHSLRWLHTTTEFSISSRVYEEDTSVIIASIAFGIMMGMNLCNITDSINLGLLTIYGGLS